MTYQQPPIVDRSATKPIYIIVAEDSQEADGIAFYKTQDITEGNAYLDFRGFQLTKTQTANIVKDPRAQIKTTKGAEIKQINRRIPWQKVIRMENITYNKTPQGEKND